MNLFKRPRTPANTEALRQVKAWAYDALDLTDDVPISISQLQCHEPDCPPVETVISVMTQPVQTYKMHAPIDAVQQADVQQAIAQSDAHPHPH